jgi:hypothetical protein
MKAIIREATSTGTPVRTARAGASTVLGHRDLNFVREPAESYEPLIGQKWSV